MLRRRLLHKYPKARRRRQMRRQLQRFERNMYRPNRTMSALITTSVAAMALSGCGGGGSDSSIDRVTVRSVNTIPDGGTSTQLVNGVSLAQQNYFSASAYQPVATGLDNLTFTLSGKPGVTYPTQTSTLTGPKYSAILFGLANASVAAKSPQLAVVSDTDITVPDNSIRIRFAQAAPDAPTANFLLNLPATTEATASAAYATVSGYQTATAGTYAIQVNSASDGTSLASNASITFSSGHHYTVFLSESSAAPTPTYSVQYLDDGT